MHPLKRKIVKTSQVPYMNDCLRRAINMKNMLKRTFNRFPPKLNGEHYRKEQNKVTAMRKNCIRNYLSRESCECVSSEFWERIRPIISCTSKQAGRVFLVDDSRGIASNQTTVASMFNEYFVNIAESIGNPDEVNEDTEARSLVQKRHSNHSSIMWINVNVDTPSQFKFQHVASDEVNKKILKLSSKKSMGCDKIPPKMVKLGVQSLCTHITFLINMCIDKCVFPSCLKKADVTPFH